MASLVERFIDALDSPEVIWKVAFERHISESQQALLLVLTTMPTTVELRDLEQLWSTYCKVKGITSGIGEFRRSLRSLEGSFLAIAAEGSARLVSYRDPSVADYMVSYLEENPAEVGPLVEAMCFFEQVERIFALSRGGGWRVRSVLHGPRTDLAHGLRSASDELANVIVRLYEVDSTQWRGGWLRRSSGPPPMEERMRFIVRFASWLDLPEGWIEDGLLAFVDRWGRGDGDKDASVALEMAVAGLDEIDSELRSHLKAALLSWLSEDPVGMDDWVPLIDFTLERLEPSERVSIEADFHDFVMSELEWWPPPDLERLDEYAQLVGLDDLYSDLEAAKEREREEDRQAADDVWERERSQEETADKGEDNDIELLFANMERSVMSSGTQ